MIQLMSDLPEDTLGLIAEGLVTGADYEQVVMPAIDEKLQQHKHLSLVYHLGESFEGFDAAAMWDDTRVGLLNLASWERIALVTDVDWIRHATKAFGFVMPCQVRVFENSDLNAAKDWVSFVGESALECELMPAKGLAVLTPKGRLNAANFESMTKIIDPYIEEKGALSGLMILAESFSGWSSFAGLLSHVRFVKDHHKKISKVAFVTDRSLLSFFPKVAKHFVDAELKHFDLQEKEEAMSWLESVKDK